MCCHEKLMVDGLLSTSCASGRHGMLRVACTHCRLHIFLLCVSNGTTVAACKRSDRLLLNKNPLKAHRSTVVNEYTNVHIFLPLFYTTARRQMYVETKS